MRISSVQYKHGLKLAMRPFGTPTTEAIDERRGNLSGALMAFTAEPIEQMVQGPKQQQLMAFPNVLPEAARTSMLWSGITPSCCGWQNIPALQDDCQRCGRGVGNGGSTVADRRIQSNRDC